MIEYRGEIAGYIMLTKSKPALLSQEHQDRFPEESVDDLDLVVGYAVDPAFRGQRIATHALATALEFASSALNARYVFASANRLNEPSKVVLLRSGFEIFPHSDSRRHKFVKKLNVD